MKKVFFVLAAMILCGTIVTAQEAQSDSLKQIELEEIIVSGTRARQTTPVSYSNISAKEIKKENAARNIPAILQTTPSLVSFTEDGLGVGNTYFRIRGTDATRINVTLNGMPLNNPESQEVFWVNLPDLSNSLQNVQIQRGVGTSTNGSAAFGASISMKTVGGRSKAYGEASTTIGSYNTFLSTIATGTGILKNGLSLDARYSRVFGDGYIRNGSINHSNLYVALSHYADKQLLRLSYINGIQHTGITWEGVTQKQIDEHGRRYNPAGKYKDEAGNTHYYDNETDNYYSDILQLLFSRELTDYLSINSSLSWNHGYGYYENYKTKPKFTSFGLKPQLIDGVTYEKSDMIRQKLMENDFYVANIGLEYNKNALKMNFGAMYSLYDGDHFGKLPWIKYWEKENKIDLNTFEWYRNKGKKTEFSIFAKADYQLTEKLSLFADMQYRHIDYRFTGIDDDLVNLTSDFDYDFFNPKAGVFMRLNQQNSIYFSAAIGQREPLRTDLKDGIKGGNNQPIKPERMIDYELGYRYNNYSDLHFGANLYYMDYNNQMVQTGRLNDVGYKLMENVKKSYRAGAELEFSYRLFSTLRLDANYTWSINKIKDYTAFYNVYDKKWKVVDQKSETFNSTDISYSPSHIAFAGITYEPMPSLYLNLNGKYVGKQYLDNTSNEVRSLSGYEVINLSAGYTFSNTRLGEIGLQLFANNIFGKEYSANGYAAKSFYRNDKGTDSPDNYVGLYPQATQNYMARLTIRF